MQLSAAAHELREQRLLTEAVRGILTPAVRANLSPEQQAFLSSEASWQPPPPAAGLCTYLSCTCNVPAIPWFCVCKLLTTAALGMLCSLLARRGGTQTVMASLCEAYLL